MDESQVDIDPEAEARTRWEQVLRGKSTVAVDPVPVEEITEVVEVAPVVIDNGPEAVLARLYKSMVAA